MSIIRALLKWGTRAAFFFICMFPFNYGQDNGTLTILILDFIFSLIALARVRSDDIVRVITGFGPDGDYGFYEYTDNMGIRVAGWLFWFVSFCIRLFMLHLIYHQLFLGGVNLL